MWHDGAVQGVRELLPFWLPTCMFKKLTASTHVDLNLKKKNNLFLSFYQSFASLTSQAGPGVFTVISG